ncbi:MAG: VOC family protein [Capnocytophaga sp.]|nr:VOC family protein [Capnocytophaga sp.]
MKIEHIAVWVNDLEGMKQFYQRYFQAKANEIYHNPAKKFTSYFLEFERGARLELMNRTDITENQNRFEQQRIGLIHLAFSVGDKNKVNELTELLRKDGYKIVGEPRTTGDGYYESVVLDPESNIIEITE